MKKISTDMCSLDRLFERGSAYADKTATMKLFADGSIGKLFFMMSTVFASMGSVPAGGDLPSEATGTFVQRKTLSDVGVTLVSTGTFRFERDRFFEWNTVKPVPSVFFATPTNYFFTANGRTAVHALDNDISEISRIFEIREVRDLVEGVDAVPPRGFPSQVTVRFKNGDRLTVTLVRNRDGGDAR